MNTNGNNNINNNSNDDNGEKFKSERDLKTEEQMGMEKESEDAAILIEMNLGESRFAHLSSIVQKQVLHRLVSNAYTNTYTKSHNPSSTLSSSCRSTSSSTSTGMINNFSRQISYATIKNLQSFLLSRNNASGSKIYAKSQIYSSKSGNFILHIEKQIATS